MKINWSAREVDVFLSLAETLSFRRTALQMHLSQSAVSGTVARLEEMLDVRLFERTTRTVQLTLAGEVFAEQARFLRHQMEETVRRVQEVAQLQVGRIALAALPSLAAGAVPRAFARFATQHPGVQMELIDSLAGPAFDMVRAGRVDFALTAANPAYADLDYTPLVSDRFVLLLSRAQSEMRGAVEAYASGRNEVEHLATIAAMVAAGLGVSALPELAAQVVRRPEVVTRALKAPVLHRPIGLITLRGRPLSLAAQAMVALLRQEVAGDGTRTG